MEISECEMLFLLSASMQAPYMQNCLFNQCTFNTVDKLADHHTRSQQGIISHHNALWLFQTSAGRHGYAAQQSIAQCALSSSRVTCCQSGPVECDNELLLT